MKQLYQKQKLELLFYNPYEEVIFVKVLVIIALVALGFYWLLFHTVPYPFNHEQFGLYQHNIHRIIGIIFLLAAGLLAWKWKKKS